MAPADARGADSRTWLLWLRSQMPPCLSSSYPPLLALWIVGGVKVVLRAPTGLRVTREGCAGTGHLCHLCHFVQKKYGTPRRDGTSLNWRGSEGHIRGVVYKFQMISQKIWHTSKTLSLQGIKPLERALCHLCHEIRASPTHTRPRTHAHTRWLEKKWHKWHGAV